MAEVTETIARTVYTFGFSGVTATTVSVDAEANVPTIGATFDYRALSEHVSPVPEPSI
jgi:hypothetical protein